MNDSSSPVEQAPLHGAFRDRLLLAASFLLPLVLLSTGLRMVLLSRFGSAGAGFASSALVLALGVVVDTLVLFVMAAPALVLLAFLPLEWLRRRVVRGTLGVLVFAAATFALAIEYFFFEEFTARYNHVALDYVLYPTEVVGNIQESYDVPFWLGFSLAVGLVLGVLAARLTPTLTLRRPSRWTRVGQAALVVGLSALAVLALGRWPTRPTGDRVLDEISCNGQLALVQAFITADLDYGLYYPTLPEAEACARTARLLGLQEPHARTIKDLSLQRDFAPASPVMPGGRPDVIILLEESFGSEFVGVLGHQELAATPRFDEWSRRGLLLTNLIATGNRTVRGMEGILCSYPPLPPDSVVKRPDARGIATLMHVFAGADYDTLFVYGGRALFDRMGAFMTDGGIRRVIEQADFPAADFKTIWGVADEFLLDELLRQQLASRTDGQPLFAVALTVSNHKPYDVPPGRLEERPGERGRVKAVRYADWSIGHYLDAAEAAGVLEHTIVLVVGDHGARVYGSEEIPAPSYRIPALFLVPGARWSGVRLDRLASQVDLAPTLLSLAGLPARAPFFGEDLTMLPAEGGRAFLQHSRNVGLLTDDSLAVLGLGKTITYYTRSGRSSDVFVPVREGQASPELVELGADAQAAFQVADGVRRAGGFVIPKTQAAGGEPASGAGPGGS